MHASQRSDWVIVGGGSRSLKLKVEPAALIALPSAEVIEDLAKIPPPAGVNQLERVVRAAVYSRFISTGSAPDIDDLAQTTGMDRGAVKTSIENLAAQHRLVLADGHRVLMAHPFSGVDTGYEARVGRKRWLANCGWDAFAILGMLGDGEAAARSPIDGSTRRWAVEGGSVLEQGLVHFVVPARAFWDDIDFT